MRGDSRRLLILLTAAGLSVAGYFVVLAHLKSPMPPIPAPRSSHRSIVSIPPTKPACPTARLPDAVRLGEVAWIRAGSLEVIDLGTCRQAILVDTGAEPPVRFSPDGRWVAFGDGEVVPSSGGAVQRPFGSPVERWEWSPTADVLAAVNHTGGVLLAGPGRGPSTLLPAGSGVGHLAFSPDGRRLAVDRTGHGIQVLDVERAKAHTILPQQDDALVPEVAGWSNDGNWILYWRGPVGNEGGPLDAVPSSGGPWANVFDPVLPYRDFLSSCGSRIALSVGAGREVSTGKQVVLTGPPDWAFHDLTDDFGRSWFWPACSPDGRWVAVSDTYNQKESANQTLPRALWLLASDGSSRRLLVPGTNGALELPRWSSDGTVILVVLRSDSRWSSPGSLLLVRVNPSSGRLVKLVGPIADLGSAPGPGGHQLWSAISDWYRP
jgi:dipeptidyl aminopeptidase/acylaminoacyl peptidase